MPANSMQKYHRLSVFFALTSFIGCGLFSMYYFYRESELADSVEKQAEEIKELEAQCAVQSSGMPPLPRCTLLADQHIRFHRTQSARQTYRNQASIFLALSCLVPLLTLALARWWYWVLTGRFRPRKRHEK